MHEYRSWTIKCFLTESGRVSYTASKDGEEIQTSRSYANVRNALAAAKGKIRHVEKTGASNWSEVKAPRAWNPRTSGECLTGVFGGLRVAEGMYGEYSRVLLHVEEETFYVTGTQLIDTVETSEINIGETLRIEFTGLYDTAMGHTMKTFKVYRKNGKH